MKTICKINLKKVKVNLEIESARYWLIIRVITKLWGMNMNTK